MYFSLMPKIFITRDFFNIQSFPLYYQKSDLHNSLAHTAAETCLWFDPEKIQCHNPTEWYPNLSPPSEQNHPAEDLEPKPVKEIDAL